MTLSDELLASVEHSVDRHRGELADLATKIHAHPELRFEETRAAAWICDLLSAHGFTVERGLGGMPTAFRAKCGHGPGPRVAILAEYDALPQIGHACGHNLIAAGAVGAFLAAAEAAGRAAGEVVLLGTPGEEGGGGKIKLLEAGAFAELDAALMFHPLDRDLVAHHTLASLWLTFAFTGTPSHAAATPHEGRSALTACMDTFRLVDGQRVHFRDGVRVHGYITNGGQAVNIIPEHAACEFSVRARDVDELARVRAIVERCARAAAMASDVTVEIAVRQGYRDLRNNAAMARAFAAHTAALGRPSREADPDLGAGSTDMGDVSHVVPSIHPYLAICDEGSTTCHEHAFAAAACSERGIATTMIAAKAMARTALEILADTQLRTAIRDEFAAPR